MNAGATHASGEHYNAFSQKSREYIIGALATALGMHNQDIISKSDKVLGSASLKGARTVCSMTMGTRLEAAGDEPAELFDHWDTGWKALRGARVSADLTDAEAIVGIIRAKARPNNGAPESPTRFPKEVDAWPGASLLISRISA